MVVFEVSDWSRVVMGIFCCGPFYAMKELGSVKEFRTKILVDFWEINPNN